MDCLANVPMGKDGGVLIIFGLSLSGIHGWSYGEDGEDGWMDNTNTLSDAI